MHLLVYIQSNVYILLFIYFNLDEINSIVNTYWLYYLFVVPSNCKSDCINIYCNKLLVHSSVNWKITASKLCDIEQQVLKKNCIVISHILTLIYDIVQTSGVRLFTWHSGHGTRCAAVVVHNFLQLYLCLPSNLSFYCIVYIVPLAWYATTEKYFYAYKLIVERCNKKLD